MNRHRYLSLIVLVLHVYTRAMLCNMLVRIEFYCSTLLNILIYEGAELEECFPDGVYYVPCREGFVSAYRLLLASLRGINPEDLNVKDKEAVLNQLQRELQGQQCLIWLDNVQQKPGENPEEGGNPKNFIAAFRIVDFPGALLVTAVREDIWDGLPGNRKVNLGSGTFWEANDSFEGSVASKILASRAAGNKDKTTFPTGREVSLCKIEGARRKGRATICFAVDLKKERRGLE
jgi:hypothetical protein